MTKIKTIFEREFNIKYAFKNLEELMKEIHEEIKHKKLTNIKVKVEVSKSRIDFKIVGE